MEFTYEKYAYKGNEILKEIAEELKEPGIKLMAAKLLRGVMHALRNIIPLEESFQFIAQLPLILKGVYVEGWAPSKKHKKIKKLDEFVQQVFVLAGLNPVSSFVLIESDEEVVKTAIRVLRRHVSPGEIADIRACMPGELLELWDETMWIC